MKNLVLSFLILSLLSLLSCSKYGPVSSVTPENPSKGSLELRLDKNTIPSGITMIVLKLERNGFSPIADSENVLTSPDSSSFLSMNDIPVGAWNLTVLAENNVGTVLYSGQAQVTIVQNQTVTVAVQMIPQSSGGTGSLLIQIVWNTRLSQWNVLSSNPVLRQQPGTWDENNLYLSAPFVIKQNSQYKMWYMAGTNHIYGDTQSVAYATSVDGINWTKQGTVLQRGQPGTWNDRGSYNCSVLFDEGTYKMWFEGSSMAHTHNGIGYAVSNDGIHWNAQSNPVITVSAAKPQVFSPGIVKANGTYYLYYTVEVRTSIFQESIYLATSPDGMTWSDQGKVLDRRSSVAWDGIGPFHARVIFDEGRFKMYYTTSVDGMSSFAITSATSIDGKNWGFNSWSPDLTSDDTSPWSTQFVGYPCVVRDGNTLKMWFAGFSSSSSQWQIGYAEQ